MSKQDLTFQLSNEIRFNQNLGDAYDEIVCKALGINRTDHRCIDIIEQRQPITSGALADAARVSPAAITSVVDRLEKKGWVERIDDPNDRRKILLQATPALQTAMEPFYGPLYEMFMGQLNTLTKDQLQWMLDFYRGGREKYEAHIERIREQYGDR
jgi:DNA-binding MarR family transcriptional regulator